MMDKWEKEIRKKRKRESLIINRPEVLKKTRRRIEFSLTTIGWAVWIFLCRPLLIILLWFLSFRVFFRHMVDLGGFVGLQQLKIYYVSVIIVIIFLVRGWNLYNKVRYGKKTRRKFVRGVSDERLEKCFKLPQGSAHQLQGMKRFDVDFFDGHQIRIRLPGKPQSLIDGYFKPS
ncbi:MAG: poly-beta-1,6-N-acetyl-D-glucosamine biosynthesis protein PgaD [Candidatus Omnitrophica bacterium]|nr:poly-beta-1,6-N-acetyl-D-glucosamine biosynthesis protein PgaD [Candidatus Omnitrophota bacterium]